MVRLNKNYEYLDWKEHLMDALFLFLLTVDDKK